MYYINFGTIPCCLIGLRINNDKLTSARLFTLGGFMVAYVRIHKVDLTSIYKLKVAD